MEATVQDRPIEVYTNGHGEAALRFMRRRTLATHGRFIDALLRPGLRLLGKAGLEAANFKETTS